jgi:hypothetical protein
MTSTLTTYQTITNSLAKWQKLTANTPDVAQQTKYYEANIGKVKTVDEFVNNYRLFSYAMTAHGMGDRVSYAKGLMRKVLTEGVDSSKSLGRKLNDPKVLAFAKAFDFATYKEGTTKTLDVSQGVIDKYLAQAMEASQGEQNPGVQMALYFKRNAPNLKSVYGILADKTLLSVVQTTLGLSTYMSMQNVDTQAKTLSAQIKVEDFQNPQKLQKFIQRFSTMYDSANMGTGSGTASGANAVLTDSSALGINSSLLVTLQGLRLGGA